MMSIFFKITLKNKEVGVSDRLESLQKQYMLFKKNEIKRRYPLKRVRKSSRNTRGNEIPSMSLKLNLWNIKLRG